MSKSRAADALELMRKHLGLADAAVEHAEARMHLSDARTWALVFLAEHVASERADYVRDRIRRRSDAKTLDSGAAPP